MRLKVSRQEMPASTRIFVLALATIAQLPRLPEASIETLTPMPASILAIPVDSGVTFWLADTSVRYQTAIQRTSGPGLRVPEQRDSAEAESRRPDAVLPQSNSVKVFVPRAIDQRQAGLKAGKDHCISLEAHVHILLRTSSRTAEREHPIERIRERVRGAVVDVRSVRDRRQRARSHRIPLAVADRHRS